MLFSCLVIICCSDHRLNTKLKVCYYTSVFEVQSRSECQTFNWRKLSNFELLPNLLRLVGPFKLWTNSSLFFFNQKFMLFHDLNNVLLVWYSDHGPNYGPLSKWSTRMFRYFNFLLVLWSESERWSIAVRTSLQRLPS